MRSQQKRICIINEAETLIKHISYESKCKFYGRKYNLDQKWNVELCQYECKNPRKSHVC